MLNDYGSHDGSRGLRRRPGALLRFRHEGAGATAPTPGDVHQLRFELELHKLEIEMQREELQAAERAANDTVAHYKTLFELAPVPYIALDASTRIAEANIAAGELFGREPSRLQGVALTTFLDPEGAARLRGQLDEALARAGCWSCDLVLHGCGARQLVCVRMESTVLPPSSAHQCRSVLIETCELATDALSRRALPGVSSPSEHIAPEAARPSPTRSAKAVLVVEDDSIARSALEELIGCEGYTVLSAGTPEEALALTERAGHIDVLVADVRLPGLSGDQLACRLRELYPSLQVILMSGMPAPAKERSTAFLEKPIDFDLLASMIDVA